MVRVLSDYICYDWSMQQINKTSITNLKIPEDLLEGFQFKNKNDVTHKLNDLAMAGIDSLHLVSDFDLTLTAGKQPGQNLGTWDVMDELLPAEGVQRHKEIYQSFRPTELRGQLTAEITSQKWAETLDLITSYHMSIDDVEAAFLSVATLRDGAKEVFDTCQDRSVPTVILSSGIRNVIQLMAEHYKIHPDHILSNDLKVDEKTRKVIGWYSDTLIHMLNKNERGHGELSALRAVRPNVVLIGDVPDDTRMVLGDEVIRIRVLDPRKNEIHVPEEALKMSFEAGYDLVVEHSLHPVSRIIKWIAGQTHNNITPIKQAEIVLD